jgi:hypothetical protein
MDMGFLIQPWMMLVVVMIVVGAVGVVVLALRSKQLP